MAMPRAFTCWQVLLGLTRSLMAAKHWDEIMLRMAGEPPAA